MSAWVTTILSVVMAVLAAGITVGVLRGSIQSVAEGQGRLFTAVADLARSVATLTTSSAVNQQQHEDLSRRISACEAKIGELNEISRVLRTRSHIHANKLQELDPSFKLYPQQRDLEAE